MYVLRIYQEDGTEICNQESTNKDFLCMKGKRMTQAATIVEHKVAYKVLRKYTS